MPATGPQQSTLSSRSDARRCLPNQRNRASALLVGYRVPSWNGVPGQERTAAVFTGLTFKRLARDPMRKRNAEWPKLVSRAGVSIQAAVALRGRLSNNGLVSRYRADRTWSVLRNGR